MLASYDVAILGEMPLTAAQVTMLSDWVILTTRFCTFWIPLDCGILYALRYSMNPQPSDEGGSQTVAAM